jgi:hypothetical protein
MHLQSLGAVEFNYSLGESLEFASDWLPGEEIQQQLQALASDHLVFGDVYAKLRS